ncbi:unannotated protein [freshwater metagenome]|uniref:Unannotated protein n=1 Tax=freshwater metagenome TaxID=449393 RepID=A0A6J7DQS3_9ZZZZ|nr:hypothetical protein [Actinomycetota bacterium]
MPATSTSSSAKASATTKRTAAKPKAAPRTKAAPKAEPQASTASSAERVLLVPVGAAAAARDTVAGVARDLQSRYGSREAARAQMRRFEDRGAAVRGRARTDVEGRLSAVRSDISERSCAVRDDLAAQADRAVARVREAAQPLTSRFAA